MSNGTVARQPKTFVFLPASVSGKFIASWRSSSVSGDDGNASRQAWYYF